MQREGRAPVLWKSRWLLLKRNENQSPARGKIRVAWSALWLKTQNAPIQTNLMQPRQTLRRETEQQRQCPIREQESHRAASSRKHKTSVLRHHPPYGITRADS